MATHPNKNPRFTGSSSDDSAPYATMASPSPRVYRIRGRSIPLTGLVTALLVCVMTAAGYTALEGVLPPVACLVLGILLSLFAIPCHLLGGSRETIRSPRVRSLLYAAGILLNSVGTALCMAAYYIHLGGAPSLAETGAVLVAVLFLYGLTALLIHVFPYHYGAVTAAVSLLTVAMGTVSVVFWIRNQEKTLWSLGFFLLLQALITVISLHVACSDEDSPWLRFSSFASFGVLLIAAAVVLIILICAAGDCDCDCGDGGCGECCDCGGGNGGKNSKRGRRS